MPGSQSTADNALSPIFRTEVDQAISDEPNSPRQRVEVITDGAFFPDADWSTPDDVRELADLHAAEVHQAEQPPAIRRAARLIAASIASPAEVGWHHAELLWATELARELWAKMGTEGLYEFCSTVEQRVQARMTAAGRGA